MTGRERHGPDARVDGAPLTDEDLGTLDDVAGDEVVGVAWDELPAEVRVKDEQLCRDVVGFLQDIEAFVELGEEEFFASPRSMPYLSTQMSIINVAHAFLEMSPPYRTRVGEDAQLLVGMRNRLAHSYAHVDQDVVWTTATRDLPALRKRLEALLAG